MDNDKYSLGAPGLKAEKVYDSLTSKRQSVVDQGREMADLTISSVFPPEGFSTGDPLPGNNQSIGAHCVNTLASHLMFLAFPPGQPIMDLEPKAEKLRAEIEADPELWGETKLALSQLEMTHRKALASTMLSTTYTQFIKLLLVAGNGLWKHLRLGSPTFHRPDSYVVVRNRMGLPLIIIHKETVSLMGMDKDHVDFILENADPDTFKEVPLWEREVDVYSVQRLNTDSSGDHSWTYWEEWEGHRLPDTEVETEFNTPPMMAAWLIPVFGDNWGQSYCFEYKGDLWSTEALASSGNDLAAIAALGLLMVRPGSATSIKEIRKAKNLSVIAGEEGDISVFRSDKTADGNFVSATAQEVARRLAQAFLLQASIQRSGERVTAEEIQRLGQEVDKGMGGLYTGIAQGIQKYIIERAVALNEEENPDIPEIPVGLVDVRVTTGTDAMGRSNEAISLTDFAGTMQQLFPQTSEQLLDGTDFANRFAATKGINPVGLVKKPEQVAAETQQKQQDAMVQEAVSKGIGPGIKAFSDSQQQQNQPAPTTEGGPA